MAYSEKEFLESSLYRGFEEFAEENIEHWACIIQDELENALLELGFSREDVKWHIDVATKHFKETHKEEINTTYNL